MLSSGMAGMIGGQQAMDYAKAVAQQQYNATQSVPPREVVLSAILDKLRVHADRVSNFAYRAGAIADRAFGPVPTAASGQLAGGSPEHLLGQIDVMMARIDEALSDAQSNIERCERLA